MSKKSNPKKIKYENPNFQIELNQEQREAREKILQNDISILIGKSGSGKTLLACSVSLEQYLNKKIEKIVITRPTVTKEELGFLPGTIDEKMDPWISPIYANMYQLLPKDVIQRMVIDNVLEISPISYMRGRTFLNSIIIVDEIQNLINGQLEMVVQRLGKDSKMILCGDIAQIDLKNEKTSSIHYINGMDDIKGICIIELKSNHRHPILDEVLDFFKKQKNKLSSN